MKKLSVFFIMFIMLCAVSTVLFPQSSFDKIFNRIELQTEHSIHDISAEMLNDDQLSDLVVVTRDKKKDKNTKQLHLFFQTDSGYAAKPDQVLNFDKRAVAFEFADISAQHKGKELVFLTHSSLEYYYLDGKGYHSEPLILARLESVFQAAGKDSPVRSNFIRLMGTNQVPVILIPGPTFTSVLKKGNGGRFIPVQKINIAPSFRTSSYFNPHHTDSRGENFSQKIVVRIPRIYLHDFDGDKDKDIIAVVKDRVDVFFNDGNERFSRKPDFNIELELLTEKEKEKFFIPNTSKEILDVNGDGLADVAVTKTTFKTSGSITKIYVYINKQGKLEAKPDEVVMLGNSINTPVLRDLDDDGQKDLVIPEAKMGLMQLLKILIAGKISYRQSVYLRKNDKFPTVPNLRFKAEARFDLENPQDVEGEFMYFGGDYNGDSVKDLLRTESSTQKLYIFPGSADSASLFSSKHSHEVKEPVMPRECLIKDLNGDKKSDIIFDYRKQKKKKIVIFLSKAL